MTNKPKSVFREYVESLVWAIVLAVIFGVIAIAIAGYFLFCTLTGSCTGRSPTATNPNAIIDRDDILNLYVVTNLPLPNGALPPPTPWATSDEPPF